MATKIGTTKISNSYRGMRFKIGKADIENGQPGDPCNCAAARALKRQTQAKEVFVYRDVTYVVNKDGAALRFHTTPALRLETIIFDRNGEFFPGEYDLDPAPFTVKVPKRKAAGSNVSATTKRGKNTKAKPHRGIPNVRPTASQRLDRV